MAIEYQARPYRAREQICFSRLEQESKYAFLVNSWIKFPGNLRDREKEIGKIGCKTTIERDRAFKENYH